MRVLIATATAGGGHLAAAAALEEAWRGLRPRDTVERIDILDFMPRLYRRAYAEGYVRIAEKAPELYAHAFRKSDSASFVRKIQRFRRMSARWLAGRFLRHVRQSNPELILCPHFLPLEALGSVKERRPRIVCVVTDFEVHALWMEPCVDLYCVATEETQVRLLARGVPASRVAVTGIPIALKFQKPHPAPGRKPMVLILGGGLGMGPLAETVRRIDQTEAELGAIVVCGRNEALRKKLAGRRYRHPVQVLGFADNMQELMGKSHLIVTKPGGLTTSEALALGKPLLIVNPLPGQEAANSDYLLERGAAAKVNRLEDLPFRLKALLGSRSLAKMAQAAKKLGRPGAATAVCRAALRLFSFLAAWTALQAAPLQAACPLAPDEEVIFLPAAAHLSENGKSWQVRLRGWVFEREADSKTSNLLLAGFRRALGLPASADDNPHFRERAGLFVADSERGKVLTIQLEDRSIPLRPSDPAGRFEQTLHLSAAATSSAAISSASFQTKACSSDPRVFTGAIFRIPPEGLSIVSDIDDTIKQSDVLNRERLLARTFLEPYEAVPGMAEAYQAWEKAGAAFHYISASPWPLYPPLLQFLRDEGFPAGTLTLRPFRIKSKELPDLFKPSRDFKVRAIRELIRRYPRRRFVLIGDSSEQDPEVYAKIAREFPQAVLLIAIRQAGPAGPDVSRYAAFLERLPSDRWGSFRDASELHALMAAAERGRQADFDQVLRFRQGLQDVLRFADRRPDLFPKEPVREARLLMREEKEEVWEAWKNFLDYVLALDALGKDLGAGAGSAASFAIGHAAFLAKYRFAMAWIEKLESDPAFQKLLNEPVPELGLPGGTYGRLKFRFLNVATAAQFAAQATRYQTLAPRLHRLPDAFRQAIEEDTKAVWAMGGVKGPWMTVRNAGQIAKDTGFVAWFPVQKGVATFMGDTKVYRPKTSLITREQIEEIRPKLEPGDILLERREWYLSNIGLPGFWPHAALYIGTPEERRAYFEDPEVRAWLMLQGWPAGDFESWLERRYPAAYAKSKILDGGHITRVLEAISEGVSFTSLEHSAAADSLAVLRPRLSKRDKAEALHRAFGYAGRPYDFDFDFTTDAALVCSELVYKVYEPGMTFKGLRWTIGKMLGRPVLPPNDMVRQFDAAWGRPEQQLDLVLFLDGRERAKKAAPASADAFRESWKRPKWHIWIQDI